MDPSFVILFILKATFRAADKAGLLDYVKKLPVKTADAIYEKLVQDKLIEDSFLKGLFEPKIDRILDDAFDKISPKDPTMKERFVVSVLADISIVEILANLKKGALPKSEVLIPVFQRALPGRDAQEVADQFIDCLEGSIAGDAKLRGRFTVKTLSRIDRNVQELVETSVAKHPDATEIAEPFKISLAKLPTTGPLLLGRENELKLLDDTWQTEKINILSLVAWGGVGKTALVNYWLCKRMAPDNYHGAQRVFGWSFYSQGTREDRQASADEFLVKALEWFGDPKMAQSDRSPWDKGLRLAELVQKYKTLLILDGVEPLQYPPGPMEGRLRDRGFLALLKQLAAYNPGLCIITTRENIVDLEQFIRSTVQRIDLENLSKEAGKELLRKLGVKGTDSELEDAAEEFSGHALALNLLGSFLATVHDGEIRKRDLIPHLTEEEEKGGHAKRVMNSYELWLKGTAELDILYIMGLFDRPAPGGAIDELRNNPAIKGLTDRLQDLSESKWKYAVKRLRDLNLLSKQDADSPDTLDCHPLVREYFGRRLKETNPAAWRQAHSRLYEYYKNLPKKKYPDTLEEMQPLFAAVAHGCQAGLHQKVLKDVYYRRIQRDGNINYCCSKLGAFGSDLSALAGFFEVCWTKPVPTLNKEAKAGVLNWAGFRLRALGRLQETAQPTQASLDSAVSQRDWKNAASIS
jgi:hypothetical protein